MAMLKGALQRSLRVGVHSDAHKQSPKKTWFCVLLFATNEGAILWSFFQQTHDMEKHFEVEYV